MTAPLINPASADYGFRLEAALPSLIPGGEVRRANAADFPVLRGLAAFSVFLDAGARRAAHLHPNTAELDYLIEGSARVTLVDTQGQRHVVDLHAGDVAFMPAAWPHWLENTGDCRLHAIFAYATEQPQTIELADVNAAYAGEDEGEHTPQPQ
jgi:oxalate decarboxylase